MFRQIMVGGNGYGTGTDSQPYFRIFNPWSQSEKFDPQCEFIKKWIPELNDIDSKFIHKWDRYYNKFKDIYIEPIINHKIQRLKILELYKNI